MPSRLVLLALITLTGCGSGADLLAPSAGRPSIDPISRDGVTGTVPVNVSSVYFKVGLAGVVR